MRILVINGPNLNLLGQRDQALYGTFTLQQIESYLHARAGELDVTLQTFQSNSEGAIIDFLQEEATKADGLIINPGALAHYGFSLRDALTDASIPTVEAHLSNISKREPWRQQSVISPVVLGVISGLGWRSYLAALDFLVGHLGQK